MTCATKSKYCVFELNRTFLLNTLQEHQKFRTYAEISVILDSMLVYDRKLT